MHISALNAANADRYNKVRIQYPGFMWDPPQIDINKLVILVQSVYPAQVVEYSLGCGKKLDSDMEGHDKCKVEETAGLFPPSKPKVDNNNYDESFREFNVEQLINEVNDGDRGSYQPPDRNSLATGPGQSHLKTAHTGKDTDTMLQIEGIGMIAIQAGQIVVIIII